jgi:hypothetical protein
MLDVTRWDMIQAKVPFAWHRLLSNISIVGLISGNIVSQRHANWSQRPAGRYHPQYRPWSRENFTWFANELLEVENQPWRSRFEAGFSALLGVGVNVARVAMWRDHEDPVLAGLIETRIYDSSDMLMELQREQEELKAAGQDLWFEEA